jgi:hypothetical protein
MSYETGFIQNKPFKDKGITEGKAFNLTFNIDYILSINNPYFVNWIPLIDP